MPPPGVPRIQRHQPHHTNGNNYSPQRTLATAALSTGSAPCEMGTTRKREDEDAHEREAKRTRAGSGLGEGSSPQLQPHARSQSRTPTTMLDAQGRAVYLPAMPRAQTFGAGYPVEVQENKPLPLTTTVPLPSASYTSASSSSLAAAAAAYSREFSSRASASTSAAGAGGKARAGAGTSGAGAGAGAGGSGSGAAQTGGGRGGQASTPYYPEGYPFYYMPAYPRQQMMAAYSTTPLQHVQSDMRYQGGGARGGRGEGADGWAGSEEEGDGG
ncbi:hypothetical protein C8R46DRAFT_275924 [Mycena filopes]|nr:hypothetical protein C8R46DRAFT_275924 [Mycena filopes]